MHYHFACSQGHRWGDCEGGVPVGAQSASCPVCGGAGSVIPQLELSESRYSLAPVCVAPSLPSSARKRGTKPIETWRAIAGAALALTVLAGMVFSLVHGHSSKRRDQHLSQGLDYFHHKEFDRALEEYTEAIRLDPAFAATYANRASVYFNQGDLEKAINDCNHALELDPQLVLAYANRAGAYLNQGELDRAIADCTRAIELDSQSAIAFANRGAAHLNKGDLDAAIDDCSRALELSPQSSLAYANRGAAYFNKG